MSMTNHEKQALPHFMRDTAVLAKLSLCVVVLGALYYPVIKSLVQDWIKMPDFSHGFLVPVVALYFVWQRRESLDRLPAAPRDWGVAVIIGGIMLLLLGRLATEYFTMRFSLLVVLAGMILFLLGREHFRLLFFPLAFLVFMIPIPSILMGKVTLPLQFFASAVAAFALQEFGLPVLREGNIIHLANTSLEVAEACSGIRSLMSLLALGTVFAYLKQEKGWQRAVMVAACIPIAIVVNALRVTMTGFLANAYGSTVAEGFFHGFSGYALFIAAMVLLYAVSFLLDKLAR
jgi:exosortase